MTLALLRPTEQEVQQVMKVLGLEYNQAYQHVKQRLYLVKVVLPRQQQFPLGKLAQVE